MPTGGFLCMLGRFCFLKIHIEREHPKPCLDHPVAPQDMPGPSSGIHGLHKASCPVSIQQGTRLCCRPRYPPHVSGAINNKNIFGLVCQLVVDVFDCRASAGSISASPTACLLRAGAQNHRLGERFPAVPWATPSTCLYPSPLTCLHKKNTYFDSCVS